MQLGPLAQPEAMEVPEGIHHSVPRLLPMGEAVVAVERYQMSSPVVAEVVAQVVLAVLVRRQPVYLEFRFRIPLPQERKVPTAGLVP